MQSLEALLSLTFFVSILSLILASAPPPHGTDDSLYRLQLAQDAWRVLYLRGDFEDFGDGRRADIEADMRRMGEETGLCFFIDGVRFTNCRGPDPVGITATVRRTVVSGGAPAAVTFSTGR